MKTIDMVIEKDGTFTITTSGYDGSACKDATKALEAALGTVTEDTATPEMYHTVGEVEQEQGR